MRVTVFSCGPAANESERRACEHLKSRLQSEAGDSHWVLLTNLTFSVTHQFQSDEIDIIAIGPPGVRVIEVKHWTPQWVGARRDLVEQEADRVTNKARKIGTTLRKRCRDLPRVDGAFLLTREPSTLKKVAAQRIRGVHFHTLNDWQGAVNYSARPVLSPSQVTNLSRVLAPKSAAAIDGSIRRLAGYVNLELQSPRDGQFHHVYKGVHSTRQDRVVLHLYDMSATDDQNAETRASREFDALRRLQLYPWAPRILDSYQDAPGYGGEMFFFTVVDPAAPSLEERIQDETWRPAGRLAFAREAVRAIRKLHEEGTADGPMVHRNLTPRTILVRHDNSPLFTGFEHAKIPSQISIASSGVPPGADSGIFPPEVAAHGLVAADHRSDVYSLCASLSRLFKGRQDELSGLALVQLQQGLGEEPQARSSLQEVDAALSELLGESVPPQPPPLARFWTEDQVVRFRDRDYRIVTRLGSGGVGTTFKVVQVDRATGEDLGTYVGKVAHQAEVGERVLTSYNLARSHLRHTGLSTIFEVASRWKENDFIALMTWIAGSPLVDFAGVFPLLAEEQQEGAGEALALRWLRIMCDALNVLHRNGLVHGDVSPRNMIVSGSDLVLTDYDFVIKIGEVAHSPGTILYCAPSAKKERTASPADDIYALAASFFHVVFDKDPFLHGNERDKNRGLNWEGVDRTEWPVLCDVLDKATHSDLSQRFANVKEVVAAIESQGPMSSPIKRSLDDPAQVATATELSEQRVDWLLSLLQSYPGSRWGNRETRGLDSDFAAKTYVETALEETLLRDIRERRARLVILCGNAGDGKTALLQHLAEQLGLGKHSSSERVLEGMVSGGPLVRVNLDGSASWKGRSADELLDEFLRPFQQGLPDDDIVHLLAINDGRLLEWIESVEERQDSGETALTAELYELLQQEDASQESHIRFISLNQRSLVAGITADGQEIETEFLERLVDHLYGGREAADIWSPCLSCSARDRCEVLRAARVFGPTTLPMAKDDQLRARARERLFDALQAVHLRGETHITVRELRATLVYILFGVQFCDDYHGSPEDPTLRYWDRAFSPDSPGRQGEVLAELVRLDPVLESHPQIDRYLLGQMAVKEGEDSGRHSERALESARRRAFFEWTREDIDQIAGDPEALGLARGQTLRLFRSLALPHDPVDQAKVVEDLCAGISRLEDLPPQSFDRVGVVPLRITPRTPTETAFWVEKPLESFRVQAHLAAESAGIERLHRQVDLIYRYRDGTEERLRLGAELFHLLLELAAGYQLGDASTDDTFAHLSIFVQRLIREDERELLAWNPMQDEAIFKVSAAIGGRGADQSQRMILTPLVPRHGA